MALPFRVSSWAPIQSIFHLTSHAKREVDHHDHSTVILLQECKKASQWHNKVDDLSRSSTSSFVFHARRYLSRATTSSE